MTPDELNDFERVLDRDESIVSELDNERDLSDAEELADVVAEKDCTFFDRTRWTYSGRNGNGDGVAEDVDVKELQSAGALLDDPDDDGEPDTDD